MLSHRIIPVAGFVVMLLFTSVKPVMARSDRTDAGDQAEIMLELVNEARAEAGCGPLRFDTRLNAAAKGHAYAMAKGNFFSHQGLDGSRVGTRVTAQGYVFTMVGENISAGYPTAEETLDVWMKSPGHRANILTCAFKDFGLGHAFQANDQPIDGARAPYFHYWVQVFGLEARR